MSERLDERMLKDSEIIEGIKEDIEHTNISFKLKIEDLRKRMPDRGGGQGIKPDEEPTQDEVLAKKIREQESQFIKEIAQVRKEISELPYPALQEAHDKLQADLASFTRKQDALNQANKKVNDDRDADDGSSPKGGNRKEF